MQNEWEIFETLCSHLESDQILWLRICGYHFGPPTFRLVKVLMKRLYQHLSHWCSNFDSEFGTGEEFSLSLKSKFLTRVGQRRPKKKSSFLRNHEIVHPSNFPHQWVLIFDGARWRPAKVVRRARIFRLRCRHMVAQFEWKTAFHTDRLFALQKRFIMIIVHSKAHNFFIHPPTHLIRNKSNHNETETQRQSGKFFGVRKFHKNSLNVSFRTASHKNVFGTFWWRQAWGKSFMKLNFSHLFLFFLWVLSSTSRASALAEHVVVRVRWERRRSFGSIALRKSRKCGNSRERGKLGSDDVT